MENNNHSERIQRYLTDQMTPKESEAFLNDLKNNKELREEAQMAAMAINAMKTKRSADDAGIVNEVMVSKHSSPKARIVRLMRWTVSVAAVFAIVFGLSFYFKDRVGKPRHHRTATVKQKDSILNNLKAQHRAEAEAMIAEYDPFESDLDSAEYAALAQQIRKEIMQMADTTNEAFMAEYQKAVAEFEASMNATDPSKEKGK